MTVLCATDLSDHARVATRAAAAIARRMGSPLKLLHVIDEIGAEKDFVATTAYEHLRTIVQNEAAMMARDFGIDVEAIVTPGFADETVVAVADDVKASLVVVGSLGRRKQHRWLVGSVAERVVQGSSRPVLVVRDGAPIEAWARGEQALQVLVGIELSPSSRPALRFAETLRAFGPCDITVVMVAWPQGEHARLGVPPPMPLDSLNPAVKAPLMRDLERFVGTLSGAGTITLDVRPCWGRVDANLAALAGDTKADLVVIGTHHRAGVARAWHGSVSRGVLMDAPGNVACVPGDVLNVDDTPIRRMQRVLVPTDFSPLADAAVAAAYGLVGAGGTVHLLHVQTADTVSTEHPEVELKARTHPGAEALGITTELEVIVHESAATAICTAAARMGADAIVMTSHGRSGITRAVLGSQTDKVLRDAKRPVLVVPPPTA